MVVYLERDKERRARMDAARQARKDREEEAAKKELELMQKIQVLCFVCGAPSFLSSFSFYSYKPRSFMHFVTFFFVDFYLTLFSVSSHCSIPLPPLPPSHIVFCT